ncbi:MAG: hypothetical protein LBG58_07095 [Planctomycetaceae bacterium]|jgi:hypothetical protein|nr:hypothetical protein [Planctomycetaceae bacterium]
MNRNFNYTLTGISVFVLFFLSGCYTKNTFYVEGTVLFDDVPLSKAIVSFTPEESSPEGKFASGMTNENGIFKLTIQPVGKENAGTTAGNYIVTISRYEDTPSSRGKFPSGEEMPIFAQMIPLRYTLTNQSDLKAVVEKKKKNVFEFHLNKN